MANLTPSYHIPNNNDPTNPYTFINIQNSIKLTSTNYFSWKLQVEAILVGHDLYKYVDGTYSTPPATTTSEDVTKQNPEFIFWTRQDKLLFGAIIGTLSQSLIPLVSQALTTKDIWDILAKTYAKPSRGHIKQLKDKMLDITLGTLSVTEYMQAIKACTDQLAALGKTVDQEDITDHVLRGLHKSYKPVIDAVNGRDSPISFEELHEKLINHELTIKQTKQDDISLPATAFAASARSSSSGFRSYNNRQQHQSSHSAAGILPAPSNGLRQQRPFLGKCQWCRQQGHVIAACPKFKQQYPSIVPPTSFNQPHSSPKFHSTSFNQPHSSPMFHSAQANSTTVRGQSSPWLLDSGASHHVTADLQNLALHAPYDGTEELIIGDGTGLKISHIGSLKLSNTTSSLILKNVLCVPSISRNIISIAKLCSDNNVSIEFSSTCFYVKDSLNGKTLFQGPVQTGVYEIQSTLPHVFTSSPTNSSLAWHHRLGHPSIRVFKQLALINDLQISNVSTLDCNSCACNKSHQLPFAKSTIMSTKPLQYVYSDLWTSPIYSHDGFKYYLIFVDHFTKYIWFYPLKFKSDTKSVFIRFKALVEKYFKLPIITLYSDNGGEYEALNNFLAENGVSRLTTPPHTPQHNGYSERRHRHIVETGLALLTHSLLPLTFWSNACSTAVYLINRLPTSTLNNMSPYLKLFGKMPNYQKLRSFGCLCYPWLKPYTKHKLEPKSNPCIFIGYSSTQSAYHCYNPVTKKIHTSRHVQFVENNFPYTSLVPSSISSTPSTVDSWCSLSIPINQSFSSTTPIPTNSPFIPVNSASLDRNSLDRNPASTPNPTISAVPSIDNVPSRADTIISPESAAPTEPTPTEHVSSSATPHPMVTRLRNNITKPITKLNLVAQLQANDIEPKTIAQALNSPIWRKAMDDEYASLLRNNTWMLVPPSHTQNVIGCKWVFRVKRNPDGSVKQHKARLVARGFHQRPGLDYSETFSPVVKPVTVRLILSIAISHGWSLRQLDVNNAFLQGTLSDEVYTAQPPGFSNAEHPNYVCKLNKALYGLKQAPRAWYKELCSFLRTIGFQNSVCDSSLFILRLQGSIIYLLVYVDDIIVTSSSAHLLEECISKLASRFSLKDLGALSYFLGVEVLPHPSGVFLSQKKYILDILCRANMEDAKSVSTPLVTHPPLTKTGKLLDDPTKYRAAIGSLQYLSLTRPDVAYSVNKLAQYMQTPTDDHWLALKRLLRYLKGTLHMGLTIHKDSPMSLHAYSDADWARDRDDYISTTAYIIYLGKNAISWTSRKQRTRARSSTEAEYRAVASAAAEVLWIHNLFKELSISSAISPVIYCDNAGATYVCANPVFHSKMKHLGLDYHFVRENVQSGHLRVSYISTNDQLADALTKPLPRITFDKLVRKIGLSCWPPILRGRDKD